MIKTKDCKVCKALGLPSKVVWQRGMILPRWVENTSGAGIVIKGSWYCKKCRRSV